MFSPVGWGAPQKHINRWKSKHHRCQMQPKFTPNKEAGKSPRPLPPGPAVPRAHRGRSIAWSTAPDRWQLSLAHRNAGCTLRTTLSQNSPLQIHFIQVVLFRAGFARWGGLRLYQRARASANPIAKAFATEGETEAGRDWGSDLGCQVWWFQCLCCSHKAKLGHSLESQAVISGGGWVYSCRCQQLGRHQQAEMGASPLEGSNTRQVERCAIFSLCGTTVNLASFLQ